jgi:hypothetical protein
VRTGGRLSVLYDDHNIGVYAGGGAAGLYGMNVKPNAVVDAFTGAFFRPYRSGDDSVKLGINAAYVSYDRNLDFFTYGQGGYFSPRNYVAVTFPVEYSGRSGNWSYLVGAAAGIQHFNQRQSPVFPNNDRAEAALENLVGSAAHFAGQTETGPAFNLKGQIEYAIDSEFTVGASAGIDNARNYTEGIGKIYLRKTFGSGGVPAAPPNPAVGGSSGSL